MRHKQPCADSAPSCFLRATACSTCTQPTSFTRHTFRAVSRFCHGSGDTRMTVLKFVIGWLKAEARETLATAGVGHRLRDTSMPSGLALFGLGLVLPRIFAFQPYDIRRPFFFFLGRLCFLRRCRLRTLHLHLQKSGRSAVMGQLPRPRHGSIRLFQHGLFVNLTAGVTCQTLLRHATRQQLQHQARHARLVPWTWTDMQNALEMRYGKST